MKVLTEPVDGRTILGGEGLRLAVSGLGALPKNIGITVRVLSVGSSLQLEILSSVTLPHQAIPASTRTADVPDPFSDIIARVLASARREAEPALVQQLFQLYQRRFGAPRGHDSRQVQLRRLRGILELLDRSLPTSPEEEEPNHNDPGQSGKEDIESLLRWFSGNLEERRHTVPPRRSTPVGLRGIGDYLQRSVVVPDHLLQLYNALAPAGDLHWIVIPLRAESDGFGSSADEKTADGVLKIGWHCTKNRPTEAVLSVRRTNGNNWWFRWVFEYRRNKRKIRPAGSGYDGTPGGESVDSELLARLGFPGHTGGTEKMVETDGFMLRTDARTELPAVDTYG